MTLRFSCPKCAVALSTSQDVPPGTVLKCPKCQTSLRTPAAPPTAALVRPPAPPTSPAPAAAAEEAPWWVSALQDNAVEATRKPAPAPKPVVPKTTPVVVAPPVPLAAPVAPPTQPAAAPVVSIAPAPAPVARAPQPAAPPAPAAEESNGAWFDGIEVQPLVKTPVRSKPAEPSAKQTTSPKRKPRYLALSGAAAAVLVIGLGWWFLSGDAPKKADPAQETRVAKAEPKKSVADRLAAKSPAAATPEATPKAPEPAPTPPAEATPKPPEPAPMPPAEATPKPEVAVKPPEPMPATPTPTRPRRTPAAKPPTEPGPAVVAKPAPDRPPSFDDWMQDLEEAKQQAAKEQKDLLLCFDGSDWCPYSIRIARNILLTRAFQRDATEKFVLVFIDFPRGPVAQGKVKDAQRNQRLSEEYGIKGYPTFILTDAEGRPYAQASYAEVSPETYCSHLANLQNRRIERDRLLDAAREGELTARVEAARKALTYLRRLDKVLGGKVLDHYTAQCREWVALAEQTDPKNEKGDLENFFLAASLFELGKSATRRDLDEVVACVRRVDEWRAKFPVKQPNALGEFYLLAGIQLSFSGKSAEAAECFATGVACKPMDPKLAEVLGQAARGKHVLGSGTGFLVADGHILTNHHVIAGPGRVMVHLSKESKVAGEDGIPAEVVASDEVRDVALLRLKLPAAAKLKPLLVAGKKELRRGERVAAFGYPLGDTLGAGIKLTTGEVSGLPDAELDNMFLLNVKINPGNSGGPLVDSSGNVVAMVTAKSRADETVDSYGLAVPAVDLAAFLRKHLPNYKPLDPAAKEMEWPAIDQRVSPSVVRVLKVL